MSSETKQILTTDGIPLEVSLKKAEKKNKIKAFLLVAPLLFFLMIRRPPRSTPKPSSAASDVYKRQGLTTVQSLVKNGKL